MVAIAFVPDRIPETSDRRPDAAQERVAPRGDSQILCDVLWEFEWDARVLGAPIRIEVEGGVVTLRGTVISYDKALAAVATARRAPGVRDVVNQVWVIPPEYSPRTDGQVASAVWRALRRDLPEMRGEVQCTAADGWVTLEGTVTAPVEARRVEGVVQYVTGVRGLTNRIRTCPS